jgi:iron complex outermembrane recepter protein
VHDSGAVPHHSHKGATMIRIRKTAFPSRARVASAVAALLLSVAVQAQVRPFDIPAGDLKAALDAYVAQSGQQLVYRSDDLKGQRSKGVQGAVTPEQALEQLLEGTSLKIRRDASGAAVVFLGEAGAGAASTAATGAGTPTPERQVIVVTGKAISHLAESNRTGTRSDEDPMALPQSVSTIDKGLMAEQQVRTVQDALANVAGVSGALQDGPVVTMRGFTAGVMRNGNLVTSGNAFDAPLITISKIEVVKGPEAIVAGLGSNANYGGVVNVITKAPQTEPVREVVASFGRRNYYEVGADLGDALTADKSLLARLVVSKSGEGRTAVGYEGSKRDYISPSLTWLNKSSGTELTFSYEYQKSHTKPLSVVYGPDVANFDTGRAAFIAPTNAGFDDSEKIASLALTQRIVPGWEIGLKLGHDRRKSTAIGGFTVSGANFGFPFPEVLTFGDDFSSDNSTKTAKLELRGGFDTGPVAHNLLLAVDSLRTTQTTVSQRNAILSTNVETGAVTDVTPILGPDFGVPSPREETTNRPKERGLLFYDHMTWGSWIALAGWRQIHFEPGDAFNPDQAAFKKGLPSLGVVYRATPTLSLYGSASKGFQPNVGLVQFSGAPVAPENSTQAELGFKAQLFERSLALTGATYQIKQRNVAVVDFDNTGPTGLFWLTVPGATARGFDFEFSGNLTKALSVRTNYAYLDKRADDVNAVGIAYSRHQVGLWGTYRFGDEAGVGWWVGTGVQGRSTALGLPRRPGSPGQWRWDINGGYQAKQWSVVAGVKNATDERLFTLTSSGNFGVLTQPREFYATARYSF